MDFQSVPSFGLCEFVRWWLFCTDWKSMLRLLGQNVGEETGWKRFRGRVKRLSTAFALAVPREETQEITPHLAFFQRIAAMIRKRLADDAEPTKEK